MRTLNNAELAFLAVIGHDAVRNKVLRLCAQGYNVFDPFAYPHLSTMLAAYMKSLSRARTEGTSPEPSAFAADMLEAVQADRYVSAEMAESADRILERYVAGDIPDRRHGTSLVERLVKQEVTRNIGNSITGNPDFEQLSSMFDASRRAVDSFSDSADGTSAQKFIFDPFADIADLTKQVPRIPTGINWFDLVSHGGARSGECWLLLGSSGGGKSCITVQLACAQALMGNSTVWVTYEQTMKGDLAERMIANITDCSLDDIRDKGYENLSEDIRTKFEAAADAARNKLTCLDMTKFQADPSDPLDTGGMYSVCKQVRQMKAQGAVIKMVIVDWIGAMVSRMCAKTGRDMTREFRAISQSEIMYAKDFGEREDVFFLFFHQTDTEAQHAKPTYCPDMTNARDDHGLCFYFDSTFTLGKRDQHNVCWLNPAKTRKAHTPPITLRLIGEKSRFELVTGWHPHKNGQFYNPEDPSCRTPDEDDPQEAAAAKGAAGYKRDIG